MMHNEDDAMTDSVIIVRDFRKVYGDLVAVDGISFEVQRGEIFGLLGPNGAQVRPVRWKVLRGFVPPTVEFWRSWALTPPESHASYAT